MADIEIEVDVEEVGDPEIPIYKITVRTEGTLWTETYGSREVAEAFLRGVKAAFSFTEVSPIEVPTIPVWRGF